MDDKKRDQYLIRTYGITNEEYKKLLQYQAGVCYICHRPPASRRLAVDHSHKTGEVRGLLCWSCNKGLAFYRDDPKRATRMAEYLSFPPFARLNSSDGSPVGRMPENSCPREKPQGLQVFEPSAGTTITHPAKVTCPLQPSGITGKK